MAKITISSTRVYYNELDLESAIAIRNDIGIYQSMRKKRIKNSMITLSMVIKQPINEDGS